LSTDDRNRNALSNALAAPGFGFARNQSPAQNFGLFGVKPEVRGLYYNGKIIPLDGYRFVECRFDNCVLQVNSDSFELVRCVIDDSSRVEYANKISKIIKLFLSRYSWATPFVSSFFLPIKNQDGTVTISDTGA
jgi:hypothetical protein